MTKLSTKQTAVLANAVNRPDGCLMPLPEDIPLKGGALTTMLRAMERRSLTECSSDGDTWTITAAARAAEQAAPAVPGKDNCKGAPPPLFRPGTRQAQLLDLVLRDEGADIDEMMQLTGWRPTVCGQC